jgi:osmotically inducible protein OsmC
MAARTANALWEGSISEGRGQMSLGSGAFEGNYSFKSRFEEGENGTNPEELIAAAHAGCFSMALSLVLGSGGNEPESIQTQAKVTLRNLEDTGPTITKVALTTRARVPGLDDEAFQKAATAAKDSCVVSRALAGVEEITLDATLDS